MSNLFAFPLEAHTVGMYKANNGRTYKERTPMPDQYTSDDYWGDEFDSSLVSPDHADHGDDMLAASAAGCARCIVTLAVLHTAATFAFNSAWTAR